MLKNKLHSIKIIIFVFAISFLLTNFSQAVLVGNTAQATLKLSPETGSFTAGTNFTVSIYLNTANQNVVAAAAYLNYDKVYFQAVSIDTTGSVFTAEAEKVINTTNGIIKITLGKPTPGVNTSNGLVAKINFQALSAVSPTADNLTFQFTAGATTESNVIKDDGLGTDILSGVYNGRYAIQSNICTSFTYSSWGICQPDNTQARTIVTKAPPDCTGGNPVLSQSCVYTPPACTSFTYSAWSSCQPNNTQSRTVISQTPSGCSGGNPILSQSCAYTPSTPEPTPTLTPTPTPTLTPTPTPTPEVDITQIQVEILSVQESLSELANLIKINPQNPEIPSRFSALTQKLLEISAKIQALKSEFIFMRNLYLGIRGEDVKKLQGLLAKDKTIYPKGLITGYYGILTQKAVQRFQCKYNIICSGSLFTTGYGRLGPKTRTKLDELYGQ